MNRQEQPPPAETTKEEIAREIARVHLESYGERARDVMVALHEDFVAVMMNVDLSQGERTLVDAGRADAVRRSREVYQETIAATFVAIVERATGRRVVGFASRAVIDDPAPWAAEIFRFEPIAAESP